jgi:hypothetical protein
MRTNAQKPPSLGTTLVQAATTLALVLLTACGGGDPEPQEHDAQVPIPDVCEQQPRPAACL